MAAVLEERDVCVFVHEVKILLIEDPFYGFYGFYGFHGFMAYC